MSPLWTRKWRAYLQNKRHHFYSSTAVEYFDFLSNQISVFSPAEAEESEVESQQGGHHVSDDWTGFTGVEEETKPEGRQQSAELTHHEVHLQWHGGGYLLQVTEPCSISDISAATSLASDIYSVWAPSRIQQSDHHSSSVTLLIPAELIHSVSSSKEEWKWFFFFFCGDHRWSSS